MNTPYTKEQFLSLREKMDAIAVDEDAITIDEKVDDTWNIGDKFIINADDDSSKKLTVEKIVGNKLLGSDGNKYSKYGVTKFSESVKAVTEDDADEAKFNILNQIIPGVETVIELVDELEKLDREDGASGQMDLMDQITTMRKSIASMLAVVQRSMHIVPPKGGLKY
jgi:hypothetical protein